MTQITDPNGVVLKTQVPTTVDIIPVGSSLIVESIGPSEMSASNVIIPEESVASTFGLGHQGYIVSLGSGVSDDWGFKVGQRVLLQGKFTPVPENHKGRRGRMLLIVEPPAIKAILTEEPK